MKNAILTVILLIFLTPGRAQTKIFTLNDCMTYAVENNTGIKKQELTNDNYRQDMNRAIAAMFPSVEGRVNANASFGRSIDPVTNTYGDIPSFDNYYELAASVPVFTGLANINTIRMGRIMTLMGIEQLQRLEDDIALKTMQAYFDVVYLKNSVEITLQQLETSRSTLVKSKKLEELGLKSAADVVQVEVQVASDDLLLVQQQNKLEIALLALKEQMNYPINDSLEVRAEITGTLASVSDSVGDIVAYAVNNNPKVLESAYHLHGTVLNYKATKGYLSPSISLNGGYSTKYVKKFNTSETFMPFANQFRDNKGFYVGASLYIPIFNRLVARTSVNRSRNDMRIAEQQNIEVEREIRREVTQAALEMEGYRKEFVQADKKVEAADLAHQASVNKYEQGILNAIDMQTTANTLLMAKSQRLNAQLQCIIKTYLVAYYNGTPLIQE